MVIFSVKGLGEVNTKIITGNNTYLINRHQQRKLSNIVNNFYIEWITNSKGEIVGLIEVYFDNVKFNGKFTEKIVNSWGNVSQIV